MPGHRISQTRIQTCIEAARRAGLDVAEVEVTHDGTVRMRVAGASDSALPSPREGNSCDAVFLVEAER